MYSKGNYPFIDRLQQVRRAVYFKSRRNMELNKLEKIKSKQAIIRIVGVDYQMMADKAKLIIDTRNAMRDFLGKATVVKA